MSIFEILEKEAAIEEIQRHILNLEPPDFTDWHSWYVGITDDPARRHKEHTVAVGNFKVVCVQSEEIARSVENFFIEHNGTDGGEGGGASPRFVYAFKKTSYTNPAAS